MKNSWGLCPIPSGAFDTLFNQIDTFVSEFFLEPSKVFRKGSYPYNIYCNKKDNNIESYTLEVALAGISKDKINVKVVPSKKVTYLSVSVGKTEEDKETVNKQTSSGKFNLELALADEHDIDNISCSFKDGLLTVIIPVKKTEAKPATEIVIQ